jgi:carboxyl-terminal processing protease
MKTVFLFVVLCFGGYTVQAQTDSVKNYMTTALELMKTRSVNKNKINWTDVYASSYKAITNAKTIRETYPVIEAVVEQLGDAHSHFYKPELVSYILKRYSDNGLKLPLTETKIIDNAYGYFTIPAIGSYNFADWNEYVNYALIEIKKLDNHSLKGWIIDLRENDGGMLLPMYAGLSSFVENKKLIGYRNSDLKDIYFNIKKGTYYEGNTVVHRFNIKAPKLKNQNKPIVVLTSKKTGSSGEFITIALSGLKNTTILGVNTAGLTSANQEHPLADHAFLVLTEGNTIDYKGKTFDVVGEGIAPTVLFDKVKDTEALIKKAKEIISTSSKK